MEPTASPSTSSTVQSILGFVPSSTSVTSRPPLKVTFPDCTQLATSISADLIESDFSAKLLYPLQEDDTLSISNRPFMKTTSSVFYELATSMSSSVSESEFSTELLSRLQQDDTLKELYSKDAGVSEGYTILEHTQLVLETAAKWKSSFDSKVLPLVSWKEFLLFLALHDIGKGIAKESESAVFGTSITFKEHELKKTQDVLRQVMERVGLEDKKITLFSALLSYDSQGLYLRGLISKHEVFDNLIEMAFHAEVPLNKMYDLLEVFHAIDAASYPNLFSTLFRVDNNRLIHSNQNQKLVDDIRESIRLSQEGLEVLSLLANEARTGLQGKEKLGVRLSRNGEKLFTYLRLIHGRMLLDKSVNSENKDLYRKVKRDFRDILLAIVKESGKDSFKTRYLRALYNSGGRKEMDSSDFDAFYSLFFQYETNQTTDSIHYFSAMIDELLNFRKDYLIRYSKEKVERFLAEEKGRLMVPIAAGKRETTLVKNLRAKISSMPTESQDSLNLLHLTFIHGSNSAIMPNLLLTDMQLIPTGRLFKMGIIPFSGELQEGATSSGVNSNKISGTSLDNGERALSYAYKTDYHTNVPNENEILNKFINSMNNLVDKNGTIYKTHYDTIYSGLYIRYAISILRLRSINQQIFNELEPRLIEIINRMEADYNEFKRSEFYRSYMPTQEDPTKELGYKYHDYVWFRDFKGTEDAIQRLKKAMTEPIFAPEGVKEAIKSIFPITFGSTTLNPLTAEPQNPSERCSVKATRLGKDLQYIFVNASDITKVRNFLKGQGLENTVKVIDNSHLDGAILLNRLAAPYFCDIASRKKMETLDI